MAAIRQDLNVGLIAFIGVVGSMVLLILVVGVQAWFAYETDAIRNARYATDQNIDWLLLRDEQYTNIGDSVGNATIYAGAGALTGEERDVNPSAGYRWTSENRETLAIPIHAAMAQIVNQHGGNATAEQMAALDHGMYVRLNGDTDEDPQMLVAREAERANGNKSPQAESPSAGEGSGGTE